MLLHNFNDFNSLCNSGHDIVMHFSDHVLDAKLGIGQHAGNLLIIPCIFILFLCYNIEWVSSWSLFGMTASKPRLNFVIPDQHLLKSDFQHGQLYETMSRVGNPENCKLSCKSQTRKKTNTSQAMFLFLSRSYFIRTISVSLVGSDGSLSFFFFFKRSKHVCYLPVMSNVTSFSSIPFAPSAVIVLLSCSICWPTSSVATVWFKPSNFSSIPRVIFGLK